MNPSVHPRDLKIALFFGGGSNERNISLDSARTFFDAIRKVVDEDEIRLIFIDPNHRFHLLEPAWMYCNTIEDFERQKHRPLLPDELQHIITSLDVLCPLVHGKFGEDGQLTALFEAAGRRAFLGAPSHALALTLDKYRTVARLAQLGFATVPNRLVTRREWRADATAVGERIRAHIPLDARGRLVTKPNNCGSSDGVSLAPLERLSQGLARAFAFSDQALVEQRILGREFSLIVLEDGNGAVFPLLPTEVEVLESAFAADDAIYTRNKKYMPGSGAFHHTPIRVSDELVARIRDEGKRLFSAFGMQDWARFDGFIDEREPIIWSDLNGIPGCGLDSFLFQQAALFGLGHREVFLVLLADALAKEGRVLENRVAAAESSSAPRIAVVGGGSSTERHVSRMSWFNVTQKLRALNRYRISSVYLDQRGRFWQVPNFVALQHTVNEIDHLLERRDAYQRAVRMATSLRGDSFTPHARPVEEINFEPRRLELAEFRHKFDFVFIALHGGIGEDGTLQAQLDALGLPYNGSGARVSHICMDKTATNRICREMAISGFAAPGQCLVTLAEVQGFLSGGGFSARDWRLLAARLQEHRDLAAIMKSHEFLRFSDILAQWSTLLAQRLRSPHGLVLKPRGDGCSSGVMVARHPEIQVALYLLFCRSGLEKIPLGLLYQSGTEEDRYLHIPMMEEFIAEQYLGNPDQPEEYLEMTVGVLGDKGRLTALLPSQTLAETDVLSLDEKFNKGVGINLTPPPALAAAAVSSIRERVKAFADGLGLSGYARIDIMYHVPDDLVYLIEVNTLPGLTSATIIFTQALTTPELRLKPSELLDRIVDLAMTRFSARHRPAKGSAEHA